MNDVVGPRKVGYEISGYQKCFVDALGHSGNHRYDTSEHHFLLDGG